MVQGAVTASATMQRQLRSLLVGAPCRSSGRPQYKFDRGQPTHASLPGVPYTRTSATLSKYLPNVPTGPVSF